MVIVSDNCTYGLDVRKNWKRFKSETSFKCEDWGGLVTTKDAFPD